MHITIVECVVTVWRAKLFIDSYLATYIVNCVYILLLATTGSPVQ